MMLTPNLPRKISIFLNNTDACTVRELFLPAAEGAGYFVATVAREPHAMRPLGAGHP
jgi:hypothetical protein